MAVALDAVNSVLKESEEIQKELQATLSTIRVKLDKKENADVIDAIRQIFGSEIISDYGNVYITYDMYNTCINLIRDLGKLIGEASI